MKVLQAIGLKSRARVDFENLGLRALDIHRLRQVAEHLNVSIDWLLGHSEKMELS